MQGAKETASNIAASANSGMEKTKATAQEKFERLTAHDQLQKDMATEKKQEKINQAEWNKQEMRENNVAARQAASAGGGMGTHTNSTTRATGQPMGGHQMSALPGHGTGQPTGHVTEGVVGSHPIGTAPTDNPRLGGGDPNTGYSTGGAHR